MQSVITPNLIYLQAIHLKPSSHVTCLMEAAARTLVSKLPNQISPTPTVEDVKKEPLGGIGILIN